MAIESTEKRQFIRMPLSLPVFGKSVEGFFRGHNFKGRTKDISYNGLCIEISVPNGFSRGQNIKFKTQLYKGDYRINATGVVRWVDTQNKAEGTITIGVKLTKMKNYGHWTERIEAKVPKI